MFLYPKICFHDIYGFLLIFAHHRPLIQSQNLSAWNTESSTTMLKCNHFNPQVPWGKYIWIIKSWYLHSAQSTPWPHYTSCHYTFTSWWHHPMEIFSTLLALCEGNSLVTDEFPSHRPVMWIFDVFLWSTPKQTIEQTIQTLVIWDAIVPIMTSL